MLIWLDSPLPRWNRFVLLDRDGVLNVDRPDFIKAPDEFHFYEDSLHTLRWLREREIHPILISNQSGLGRKIITEENFWKTHEYMMSTIKQNGGEILAAFYCPHHPGEGCLCRKPLPGLILAAADLYSMELKRTPFIGDRPTDLEAARRAGCRGYVLTRPHDALNGSGIHEAAASETGEFGHSTLLETVKTLYSTS